VARKKHKKIYRYSCTLTGEEFKVTAEAKNPDELMSVKAYYEMNPEKDDRPEHIKIQQQQQENQ
jgi:hypothetical protein